jgi:cell division protein FtsA
MAKVFMDRVLVSIDIGTTKICVIVAHKLDDDHVEIIGIGKAPSDGLKKGVVVDVAKTIHSIKNAVKEAEISAGIPIESAYIGISGGHITSVNSSGVVPIKQGEVRSTDIANVLAAARAIPIPEGQQILHTLPQYFVIDSQDRVHDPLGMYGIRLEVEVHIILGAIASVQTLVRCCEMAGIKVNDIILEQLASADAVLSPDERELGVAMLDIGGGTSDLAIYHHGSIRHTFVLPVAGNHFTHDVAVGLRTTIKEAERIKRDYGLAFDGLLEKDDVIEIDRVQGNEKQLVQVSDLLHILNPRAEEILTLVRQEIIKHKMQSSITAGLVLTGGGSLLRGMKELAETIFEIPVRIGNPRFDYRLPDMLDNPMYATGYGLIIHALKQEQTGRLSRADAPVIKQVFERMKSWVSDFF